MGQLLLISEGAVVFRACGKTPERRDVLTICRKSEAMQFAVEKACRQNIKAISSRFLWLIGWNCVILLKLILSGHRDNAYPASDMDALTACLIF